MDSPAMLVLSGRESSIMRANDRRLVLTPGKWLLKPPNWLKKSDLCSARCRTDSTRELSTSRIRNAESVV